MSGRCGIDLVTVECGVWEDASMEIRCLDCDYVNSSGASVHVARMRADRHHAETGHAVVVHDYSGFQQYELGDWRER